MWVGREMKGWKVFLWNKTKKCLTALSNVSSQGQLVSAFFFFFFDTMWFYCGIILFTAVHYRGHLGSTLTKGKYSQHHQNQCVCVCVCTFNLARKIKVQEAEETLRGQIQSKKSLSLSTGQTSKLPNVQERVEGSLHGSPHSCLTRSLHLSTVAMWMKN